MTAVYHITHIDNLSLIMADGCVWCDSEKNARGIGSVNIAHVSLKARRSATHVPFAPHGTLDDYVPFYFAPRSRMLYSIANIAKATMNSIALLRERRAALIAAAVTGKIKMGTDQTLISV